MNSFLQNKIVIDHYSQTISFLKDVFTSMKNKDLNAIDQLFMNISLLLMTGRTFSLILSVQSHHP